MTGAIHSSLEPGCSLTNTLKFPRLKLSRQKLAKGPDVIRQACGHRWGALPPSRTNRPVACPLVQWQRLPQAHMRSGDIIEGLQEDHPLPQAFAVFAEAGGLATPWRQSLAQGQVHPFDQGGADREAQVRQTFGEQPTRLHIS